ncbi:MAG: (deoxy)nucleoside triphosphate pyrophosphohydrolase [Myxococcota bacterium]
MTLVVAAAVAVRQDRVLVTQRPPKAHLAGAWEFPGGKLEAGESPEQALVRECQEEIGVPVRVEGILEVTFHRYERRDVLLLFYRVAIPEEAQVLHLGVADHRWATADELEGLDFPPADGPVLEKVRAELRGAERRRGAAR